MIFMTFVPSKNPREQQTQTPADSEQQTVKNRQTLAPAYVIHIGRLDRSRPEPPGHSRSQSFIARNGASVQQQQPQNAPRARCMLVHHSNIEIDSNDSLFFLRKTRESKMITAW